MRRGREPRRPPEPPCQPQPQRRAVCRTGVRRELHCPSRRPQKAERGAIRRGGRNRAVKRFFCRRKGKGTKSPVRRLVIAAARCSPVQTFCCTFVYSRAGRWRHRVAAATCAPPPPPWLVPAPEPAGRLAQTCALAVRRDEPICMDFALDQIVEIQRRQNHRRARDILLQHSQHTLVLHACNDGLRATATCHCISG